VAQSAAPPGPLPAGRRSAKAGRAARRTGPGCSAPHTSRTAGRLDPRVLALAGRPTGNAPRTYVPGPSRRAFRSTSGDGFPRRSSKTTNGHTERSHREPAMRRARVTAERVSVFRHSEASAIRPEAFGSMRTRPSQLLSSETPAGSSGIMDPRLVSRAPWRYGSARHTPTVDRGRRWPAARRPGRDLRSDAARIRSRWTDTGCRTAAAVRRYAYAVLQVGQIGSSRLSLPTAARMASRNTR
jgi:hypothetical protein